MKPHKCNICKRVIKDTEGMCAFNGVLFHKHCFKDIPTGKLRKVNK